MMGNTYLQNGLNIFICQDKYLIYACRHNQEILSYVYEIKKLCRSISNK